MLQNHHVLLTFDKVHNPLRLPRETTSERPRVVRAWSMVCFVHFDFDMCFAPQRRALFRHLNFEKWSEREVFLAFPLANVFRATTACNFSSLIWPAGSASRRFSEPTCRHSGATNHWKKHSVSRLSYLFARLDLLSSGASSFVIFFLLLFSSLTLPISAFHLPILSEVCF